MANNTYGISEIVGSSPESVQAAIENAVGKANETVRNLDWFEVSEIRGHIQNGKVADWQVSVKLGFRIDD
ncbi:dodecin [Micrococcoides hystricis]|uniref:Dodecin n=1 Tax=Micrococcoides hystricis TaxID=1572761 RepID=A0ABV6P7Q0_9MICC